MLIPLKIGGIVINLWGVFTLISFAIILSRVKKTKGIGFYYASAISSWINNLFLFVGIALDFGLVQKYPQPSFITLAVIAIFCIICIVLIYHIKDNHLKYSKPSGKIYKAIPWIGLTLYSILEIVSLVIVPLTI